MSISETIIKRIESSGHKYHAASNISEHISEDEIPLLIDEVADKFDGVLKSLVIDTVNDPNSMDTGIRLAKMYINEIMHGRYFEEPGVTTFPNDGQFNQLIVIRSEIKSMCSHHHQPVTGVCYVGCLPGGTMAGLSKYSRIVDHIARRGQLQEEMTEMIATRLMKLTKAKGIGVYIRARHGCCENRGINSPNSTTQTTVLKGLMLDTPTLKTEFMKNIELQEMINGR